MENKEKTISINELSANEGMLHYFQPMISAAFSQ